MKIAAVIVTYNKLNLLKECIHAVKNQTYNVNEIIVVNNKSEDGTKKWLETQSNLYIINQKNLGGAGGYNRGIREAYERDFDWIWTLDDDSIPQQNTLLKLVEKIKRKENIGILCSVILNKDNGIQELSVPEFKHRSKTLNDILFEKDIISITLSSFLSVLFNKEAIKIYGLPIKEMFIHYDDFEYTSRILHDEKFRGYLVLDSFCYHQTIDNIENRFLYITPTTGIVIRNYFFVLKKSKGGGRIKMLSNMLSGYYQIMKKLSLCNNFIKVFFIVSIGVIKGLLWNPKIELIKR